MFFIAFIIGIVVTMLFQDMLTRDYWLINKNTTGYKFFVLPDGTRWNRDFSYFEKTCDKKSLVQCCRVSQAPHQCQKELTSPNGKSICVDKCLADEIQFLWQQGITTTGCCCGCHVNSPEDSSYIGVEFKDIDKMKKLGYTVRVRSVASSTNDLRPGDEDSLAEYSKLYIPKTQIWN